MGIRLVSVDGSLGDPDVGWSPVANSQTVLAGDVLGLTTGGLAERLGSAAITSGGGIWGFSVNDFTSDGSGNLINPSAPSGVAPGVPAQLALASYDRRVATAPPIAGVQRGQAEYWTGNFRNIFIQRHKAGTRCNMSLVGKKCDLTWNSSTNEWEVDTTATSLNCIIISQFQFPLYKDNKTLWDSATYATDTYAAWVAFQVTPAFYAQALGLRY